MNLNPSQETLAQIFNVYASRNEPSKPGVNEITVKDLKYVLEDLGQKVTEVDLHDLFNKMDTETKGYITFNQFYTVMSEKLKGQELYETVLNGFKYLDRENKGYMDVNEFRYLMASFGEKFPLDEIKAMIEVAADPEDPTKIRYEKFTNKMFFRDLEENPPPTKGKKDGKKDSKKK